MNDFIRVVNPKVKPCHICGKGLIADGNSWTCNNENCNYYCIEIYETNRDGDILDSYKGDN